MPRPEECAWLALIGVAGAWAILVGGQILGRRRTANRCCGGSSSWSSAWAWGAAAWGVADGLHANLPPIPGFPSRGNSATSPAGEFL